jgi:tetratricopeptide (TPR) repeat protein
MKQIKRVALFFLLLQGVVHCVRADDPLNSSAIGYRESGHAKYVKGDLKGAIADYDQAIKLEPKFSKAYVDRAEAKYDQGNFDGAIDDCNSAIAVYPKLIPAYIIRGASTDKKGDKKKALDDYEHVLLIDPENPIAYNNIAWIYAAAPDPGIRNATKALEYATKACKLTNWQANAFFGTLAAACAEAGDFDNALKFQSQYLAAFPHNKEAQTKLSMYQNHIPYHEVVAKYR